MITQNDYSAAMDVVKQHSGFDFLQVRMDHLKFFKGDAVRAVTLAYVLRRLVLEDASAAGRARLKRNDFWLELPGRDLTEDLGMTHEKYHRAVQLLERDGLLMTQRRAGNKLWVWLNVAAMDGVGRRKSAVDPGFRETRKQNPGNTETHPV